MEKMRVLVANEPRTYREALSEMFREVMPHAEVSTVDPAGLGGEVGRLDPHVVLYSRAVDADEAPSYPPVWIELYPEGEDRAEVVILEERATIPGVRFGDLLSVLDRTELLCSTLGDGRRSRDGRGEEKNAKAS